MRIEGVLVGAFSEPINGAPVVASILQPDNTTRSLTFERERWNNFVYSIDEDGHFDAGTVRVVVEGEDEFNCFIQRFAPESKDERGEWGYLLPSGTPVVLCGTCGKIVPEEYRAILNPVTGAVDDDELVTQHECWEDPK